MEDSFPYQALADTILVIHTGFVLFVILALPFIYIGAIKNWHWIRNFWFRLAHLIAIGVVVAQAWIGLMCPLTSIESQLRLRSGQEAYNGSFIQYWLHKLIYYDAPLWVFSTIYTLFGLAVLLSWLLVPPEPGNRKQ